MRFVLPGLEFRFCKRTIGNGHLATPSGFVAAASRDEGARFANAGAQAVDLGRDVVLRGSPQDVDEQRRFSWRVNAGGDAYAKDSRLLQQLRHVSGVHGFGAQVFALLQGVDDLRPAHGAQQVRALFAAQESLMRPIIPCDQPRAHTVDCPGNTRKRFSAAHKEED